MPSSLASAFIGLGLILAILGFATAAIIAGTFAVVFEFGVFAYDALAA